MSERFVTLRDRTDSRSKKKSLYKLKSEINDQCYLEVFDNPSDLPKEIIANKNDVINSEIPVGTRVYCKNEENEWFVGRLKKFREWYNNKDSTHIIQFENRHSLPGNINTDRHLVTSLHSKNLFVRESLPLNNPTKFLEKKISERKIYFDRRSNYQRSSIKQRVMSKGIDAIFSSVIELEKHQVDIITRVLQDPLQRYLLADEVGLGKTIEAGIILRQFVIDSPDEHMVLVLVPKELRSQWIKELKLRFLLADQIKRGSVNILSYDEVDPIIELLNYKNVNMIIVDEAHRLTEDRHEKVYQIIQSRGKHLNRLLLLSGTPLLNNEVTYYKMLALLDPIVYPSTAFEKFKKQIINRERLAEIVSGIIPEEYLIMEEKLDDLKGLFPEDNFLLRLIETLMPILNKPDLEEDDPIFLEKLKELQEYISEVYKLDRRILRNRRQNVKGLTPSRDGVTILSCYSGIGSKLCSLFDKLRLEFYKLEKSQDKKLNLQEGFFNLIDKIMQGGESGSSGKKLFLRLKLLQKRSDSIRQTEISVLLETLIDFIKTLDERSFDQKFEKVLDVVDKYPSGKIIIFCSEYKVAEELYDFLKEEDLDVLLNEDSLTVNKKFASSEKQVLAICDHRSEEGLNLQGNDRVVIHLDLPLSPNRIEQRMGRVDRYGGSNFHCYLILDEDNYYEKEWLNLVNNTLKVFDRSIASLQYLLDDQMQKFRSDFFIKGFHVFQDLSEVLSGDEGLIEQELNRIMNIENLDAIPYSFYRNFEGIVDYDLDSDSMRMPFLDWLQKTLGLSARFIPNRDQEVIRFLWDENCKIAFDNYLENLHREVLSPGSNGTTSLLPSYPYTFSRQMALQIVNEGYGQEENPIRLIRHGDTFFNGLNALTELDDRGKVFGTFRLDPSYKGDLAVFICFEFLIEVDVKPTAGILSERFNLERKSLIFSLRRMSDNYFNPMIQRIWINERLQVEDDKETIAILEKQTTENQEEDTHFDFNLNYKNWKSLEKKNFPKLDNWQNYVQTASDKANEIIFDLTFIKEKLKKAHEIFLIEVEKKINQLTTRKKNIQQVDYTTDLSQNQQDLEKYQLIRNNLENGIISPDIRCEAVGAMFLSDKGKEEWKEKFKE